MSLKQAAEELLRIADEIENEANEVTTFVCEKCNHTASIAEINSRRREAAAGIKGEVIVEPITVNDEVTCPACDGIMRYYPTKASERFYFDTNKMAEEEEEEKEEEKEKEETKEKAEEKEASINYDSLQRYSYRK